MTIRGKSLLFALTLAASASVNADTTDEGGDSQSADTATSEESTLIEWLCSVTNLEVCAPLTAEAQTTQGENPEDHVETRSGGKQGDP